MPKRSLAAFLILLSAVLLRPAYAGTDGPFLLFNADTGAVLAENRSGESWYAASLTKLMTAYLTFKALRDGRLSPTSPVVISANALSEPPAKMGYRVGTVLTIDNALKMMLVKSANDIAVAVAETVGGSEAGFVAMMNQEAARLGMTSTRYINPNGLPGEGQWTNARDLAVLARAVWLEFPQYRPLFGIPAIQAGKRVLRSPNTLLERYQGANGMKTGFICASGYNVVASASRGGQTMIAVVLGERTAMSRAETAAELLNRGFATWQVVARARQTLDTFSPARRLSAAPADIRDLVCGKGHGGESEDGDISATTTANSALGPRVVTMAPVKVFTGGADPAPRRVADVPLPRPRPRLEATADVAPAFAPAGPVAVDPLDLMAPLPRARP